MRRNLYFPGHRRDLGLRKLLSLKKTKAQNKLKVHLLKVKTRRKRKKPEEMMVKGQIKLKALKVLEILAKTKVTLIQTYELKKSKNICMIDSIGKG
jgi:hypothetical protein